MKDNLKLTDIDNKVRRKWLFWAIKFPLFLGICSFILILSFTFLIRSGIYSIPEDVERAKKGIESLVEILILGPISLYISYRCAYKNQGTILLFMMMIFIPLDIIFRLFLSSKLDLFSIFSIPYDVVLFYYSYKLRKINKSFHGKILTASPTYINATSIFSFATNLEELNTELVKLQATIEPGNEMEAMALAYEARKESLMASIITPVNS